jgi:hypothetical protein
MCCGTDKSLFCSQQMKEFLHFSTESVVSEAQPACDSADGAKRQVREFNYLSLSSVKVRNTLTLLPLGYAVGHLVELLRYMPEDRFPMGSLRFLIDLKFFQQYRGRHSLTEMSTREFHRGSRRPVRRVDNHVNFMCRVKILKLLELSRNI